MRAVVLGSGGWGTALSQVLCDNGHEVTLWSHSPDKAAQLRRTRENPLLKGVLLPEALQFSGEIACAADADLVIWDPARVHTITAATQHSGAGYTLYEGRQVTGAPVLTMQRGAVIMEDGRLVAQPGRARFLFTDTSHLYR